MVDNSHYLDMLQNTHQAYPNIRLELLERLLCDRLSWSKTDFILNAHQNVLKKHREQFEEDVKKLVNGEPLQYIVACEWFYGRCFKVNNHVLIPRPETELLVEWVVDYVNQQKQTLRIVDIGTGSGAIGVTLALECDQHQVTITDISSDALAVAQSNAQKWNAQVKCVQSDVFDHIDETFDIIVSNPPYISIDEKYLMDNSVLMYEPHIALFAANNGLAIYEKIFKQAQQHLNENGILALEIGFMQAKDVCEIAKYYFPEKRVTVIKDYAQLDRIVIVK